MQAIMEAAQLKADGKTQRVIVTGCLAQRYSQDLAGNHDLQLWCNHHHVCQNIACRAIYISLCFPSLCV